LGQRGAVLLFVLFLAGCGRVNYEPLDRDAASAIDATSSNGSPGDWWNPAWSLRLPISIDGTKVRGELSDFPVLVDLTIPNGGALVALDAAALVFTSASGELFPHELELLDSQTGALIAWVRVPMLRAGEDLTFYLYYGNSGGGGGGEDPSAVWTDGFTHVFHFGDGATLSADDSSALNPGTNSGAGAAAGRIYGAASFDSNSNISADGNGLDTGPGAYTMVTFWMNYTGPYGDALFAFSPAGDGYDLWFFSEGCFGFNTQAGEVLGTTLTGLHGRWVHVAAVFYNGIPTAGENRLFIDGVEQTLTTCQGGQGNSRVADGPILWASGGTYRFTGLLDEGRVATVIRSPDWISTEFANQSDPGGFLRAGTPEQYTGN
jgi:MSHA biogenesis protein MshQ